LRNIVLETSCFKLTRTVAENEGILFLFETLFELKAYINSSNIWCVGFCIGTAWYIV
jgi:hypothetical protein